MCMYILNMCAYKSNLIDNLKKQILNLRNLTFS